ILSIFFLQFAQAAGGEAQRLLPRSLAKAVLAAHERVEQAVGMFALQIAFYSLGTKHPAVERELLPGLEADHPLVLFLHLELNAALLAAEAAVRLHQVVRMGGFLAPSAGGRVVQVRPEGGGEFTQRCRRLSHALPPSAAIAPARACCACTRDT